MLQDFKLQGSHGAHLLVGQSGIGKNRLVSEFSRLAESEFDCSVLRALCRSDHLMAPFGLMSSVLQELTAECVAGIPKQALECVAGIPKQALACVAGIPKQALACVAGLPKQALA